MHPEIGPLRRTASCDWYFFCTFIVMAHTYVRVDDELNIKSYYTSETKESELDVLIPMGEEPGSCDILLNSSGERIACANVFKQNTCFEFKLEALRFKRNKLLMECDWVMVVDDPTRKQDEWAVYRQKLRDLPSTVSTYVEIVNLSWPIPPDAEFPELKARLQTIETQANTAIQILIDFGISGLMNPIDTSTWPVRATNAVLDARLKPIETGATGARAILDLFGVENLPEFTVDETSTIESRISALESAGRAAQKTLQEFGVDI